MPAESLQDRVELAEAPSVTLVWLKKQASPDGVIDCVKVTVPANPFTLVTVMVEMPVSPALTVKTLGVAEIVKSRTLTVTVVQWISAPLVALTTTVKVLGVDPLQERVAVAVVDRETLFGDTKQLRPEGETVVVRVTVPEKPPVLVRVIVELAEKPASKVIEVGLAEMVKSCAAFTLSISSIEARRIRATARD